MAIDIADYIDRYPFTADCHWDVEGFRMSDLTCTVIRIHFCAAINEDNETEGKRPPTNHWMIFLQTGVHSSVRISVTSGESSRYPSLIELTSKSYDRSENTNITISADAAPGFTVESILTFLIEKGRDRYRFTDDYEGCRFWAMVVACDFVKACCVEPDFARRIADAIRYYYPDPRGQNKEPIPRQLQAGVFFW
ncbi:hypothetical protein FISHEDRAFT_49598 [Fistulina hepatica ATCC 64428]|uniref:DUF7770 domain-containing protein n=1 Tax=Fistulina hepatica ATCC 64428 TaxID=1128425 RepID=A0A0D7A2H7_9AGAR|nr:hypothetical protein FISHEDRAFT_49598 [Fistulina hepatica ATCC 64428]